MLKTTLDQYNNAGYQPGRSAFVRLLWYLVNSLFFQSTLFPINRLKVGLLRLFGAQVGNGVTIKPSVTIKYPWRLSIGSHAWIGEKVWIDNLADVCIGSHVCLSQGAMLLTGSHDYKQPTFDLITGRILLEEGVWIGAQAVVCPGVIGRSHSVLSVNSVATAHLAAYKVYQGNPAVVKRDRLPATPASSEVDSNPKSAYMKEPTQAAVLLQDT